MAIGSFGNKQTEAVSHGETPRGLAGDVVRSARRKLAMLVAAEELRDLASPPGNRLELLRGGRAGQHSIRIINDQWRICFHWVDGRAEAVEIVDYH
jgi:proteic killer suppression protein